MPKPTERHFVILILCIAASLGLAQALITPAWANVEEPHHFEYVRYLVEHRSLPDPDQPDDEILQRIADSEVGAHHVWGAYGQMRNARITNEAGIRTDADWDHLRQDTLESRTRAVIISTNTLGASQLREPPGYYLLVAPLQLFVQSESIETQLLAARLGSVLFGLLAVWLAYLTACEAFATDRLMRVGVPALVAVLPGFVTAMSSVGNTIAAVAALTLLLYAATRLIRRGFSPAGLALLAAGGIACLLSKPTAWIGIPVALLALPLARRNPWPRWALLTGVLAFVGVGLTTLHWEWPAAWYPVDADAVVKTDAQHGQRALVAASSQRPRWQTEYWQALPGEAVRQLRGQTVTLGVWMRAPGGTVAAPLPTVWAQPDFLTLREGENLLQDTPDVTVASQWEFHAVSVDVPAATQCMSVRIPASASATGARIEYDGLTLVAGERPLEQPPVFQNRYATRGTWGSDGFENLIANGSAERGQVLVRPQVESLLPQRVADTGLSINSRLASYQDLRGQIPLFWQSFRWVFSGFWARFGWTAPGLPAGFIWMVGVLSCAAGTGLVVYIIRPAKASPRNSDRQRAALVVSLAVVLAIFALAVLRVDPPSLRECTRFQGRFLSTPYYVQPAIVPGLALWLFGLKAWLPERWHRWLLAACVAGFFGLTIASLIGRQIPFWLAAYGLESGPTIWSIPTTWLP